MGLLGTLVINALTPPSKLFIYLCVQLIEKVYCIYDDYNSEKVLWDRQKCWQSQLFPNVKGMNSISDLYFDKRKGRRKN